MEGHEIILPEYFTKSLVDHQLRDTFLVQPDYIKREQINHIELAKKEETKHNRIQALITKLKSVLESNNQIL
ncbi:MULTISPECIES: YdeI/OmpD-associated family protein [unclassified Paenibacillus]|uniref:YdeI/OmpD-associated family protein n=1 Tax=unclassified Paenibacillus TaxID=185978 RepID=UPI002406B48D|nr:MULTISPECIES: YdeI/OmpD-associated family protein [unclassified Paenibacillus]MDF9841233.1 hypothetical protein [Paenibacillus sp. PastF-2]MDF9847595.1 hypothetical protein [Paenibacillus sp. PastM-2]MDF9854164.1 hypothetical protein [Paenibacillus sp. PastF-1]MDH6479664.1 hypothetical protein [Paenibacillus sp. PastH-2]MDH6505329.1 hypothetical protein [Paenibacillus sp. PastM-3]